MNKRYVHLVSLYKNIPDVECKGLCHESCTLIPVSKIERKRIREHTKLTFDSVLKNFDNLCKTGEVSSCKALKDQRCSIYNLRPAICRGFGVVESLECPFGCEPINKLSKTQFNKILTDIDNI